MRNKIKNWIILTTNVMMVDDGDSLDTESHSFFFLLSMVTDISNLFYDMLTVFGRMFKFNGTR